MNRKKGNNYGGGRPVFNPYQGFYNPYMYPSIGFGSSITSLDPFMGGPMPGPYTGGGYKGNYSKIGFRYSHSCRERRQVWR